MSIFICSLKAKKIPTKKTETGDVKSMRSNEVHTRHQNFRNKFRLQFFFHIVTVGGRRSQLPYKFWILFVHVCPNSTHVTSFLSSHTCSPVCSHLLHFCPRQFKYFRGFTHTHTHTLRNTSPPIIMPCKLSRIISFSTISKYPVMPRMVINNRAVSITSLLSASAE
jgi:hypothetical protein